jgi:hypothetical protein
LVVLAVVAACGNGTGPDDEVIIGAGCSAPWTIVRSTNQITITFYRGVVEGNRRSCVVDWACSLLTSNPAAMSDAQAVALCQEQRVRP